MEDSRKDVELGLLTPKATLELLVQGNIELGDHIEHADTVYCDRAELARDPRTPLVTSLGYNTTRELALGL